MKSTLKPYVAQLISLSLAATVAVGCSKKKNDSGGSSPNPDTEISSVESSDDGQTVTVTYRDKNENSDATFKCQVEQAVEGADAPEWTDCDAAGLIVDVTPKARYTFRVKAVAGGIEDLTPASRVYVAKGAGDSSAAAEQEVMALILNKGDAGSVYTKSSITFNLGVEGRVNLDDVRFEYMLNGGQWTRVGEADRLQMNDLQDGQQVDLEVRAIHRPTNSIGGSDKLSFKVALATGPIGQAENLTVTSTPDLASAKSGKAQLAVAAGAGEISSLTCAFDGGTAGDCRAYVPTLDLDQLAPGSHRLVVEAMDAAGKKIGTSTVNFCVQACGEQGESVKPMVQIMQLGDFYTLKVPEGMHVTEYSTTKNFTGGTTGQLEFYRIRTNSDPFYIGNYKCDGMFDSIIPASSPSGGVYDYCYSTFPRTNNDEYYKWLTSYGLANNHIELATDAAEVEVGHHERLVFNVFDRDFEYQHNRSRFEQLCLNARGEIQQTPNITWLDDFWGDKVKAKMVICKVTFNNGLGGLNPEMDANTWWIGSFFLDSKEENLPRNECFWNDWQNDLKHGNPVDYHPEFCDEFENPSLLEAVYISNKRWTGAQWFAQAAQARIRPLLKELTPVLH